jgi:flagellar basal body-associated protein FliL
LLAQLDPLNSTPAQLLHDHNLYPGKTAATQPAKMKRNIVIFVIILILFILIALIGYMIYYLQTRMAVGGTASSVSDMTEV